MKDIFFSTNLPAPYRVDFFNEWGKYCNLTVSFERMSATDRDAKWKGKEPEHFTPIYLGARPVGTDQTIGFGLIKCIKRHKNSTIILTNYVSPSVMLAICYCRLARIPYYMEHDGGFYKKDSFFKGILKKFLLKGAEAHLTTCEYSMEYLKSLGIKQDKIYKYPFTSLSEQDLEKAAIRNQQDKQSLKNQLGMREKQVVLTVGRFSADAGYCKGYDLMMKAAEAMKDKDIGIYLVGDEPTKEFVQWKENAGLEHIHFVGFKTKDELADYYVAADVFALPTRGDVWGLVINEAMSYGLPVISTDRCIAALELIGEGQDGSVIPSEDVQCLTEQILYWLESSVNYSHNNVEKVKEYTIEEMAKRHLEIFA